MELVTETQKGKGVLFKKAQPVNKINEEIKEFIKKMFKAMEENDGIGLAAPQVGKSLQIFVVDKDAFQDKTAFQFKEINPNLEEGYVFINPELNVNIGTTTDSAVEGCLSLPEEEHEVERPQSVTVKAKNKAGKEFTLHAQDILARVLQHEYDHLQGTLIKYK